MSASNLLDTLRKRYDIKTDAALARELEVQPCAISRLRAGGPLGASIVLKIHELLGMQVSEIRSLVAETAPHQ